MSSTIDLLNRTAASLLREGKTPSLALFKARLSGQLTAPALFAAYQHWRQQPPAAVISPAIQQNPAVLPAITGEREQLQRIEAKLDKILAILEQQHVSG